MYVDGRRPTALTFGTTSLRTVGGSMELGQKHNRTVSIQTTFATIEGTLASSGMLRLLDDLNVVARTFLTVHEPVFLSALELMPRRAALEAIHHPRYEAESPSARGRQSYDGLFMQRLAVTLGRRHNQSKARA